MLTFISFWRAAAIVLSDLASSAYYVGGDAEKVIGKSAPWFVLAVMLFSYAVRSIYIESSSMFVRGGVYRVVKEAMGSQLAKLSVSALLFDYVLTGPISAVSAGQYLAGFVADLSARYHHPIHMTDAQEGYFAAAFGVVVTAYFWWKNTQGMHESSETGATHHADHDRDGSPADRVVRGHLDHASGASSAAPVQGEHHHGPRISGMAVSQLGGKPDLGAPARRLRTLRAGHER